MSEFIVLSLSPRDSSRSRQCAPIIARRLKAQHCECVEIDIRELPAFWADDHTLEGYPHVYRERHAQVAAADGIFVLLPTCDCAASGNAKAIIEIFAPALTQKPMAFVVDQGTSQSRLALRDLVIGVLPETQTFYFPQTVHVTAEDFVGGNEPSPQMRSRLETMVAEFIVFSATLKLFHAVTGHAEDGSTNDLHVLRINHLNILTSDLGRSLKFYSETLGVRYLYNLGPRKVVTDLAGFEFFIEEVEQVRYPPFFHFGVRTTARGVRALEERLSGLNIEFVKGNGPAPGAHPGPDGVRWALYFEDPDGLLVEVYSPELAIIERSAALVT